jgi:hypothetical protein
MTTAGWVALAFAVFGAFSYGAGSILQAVGARRSTSTVRTLGHPLYLIGVGCDLLAWAGSMVALHELAVYLVQSVLAGSLAVTVVAARVFLKSQLRGQDVFAVTVTIGALTVLAMSAGEQEQVTASNGLRIGFCAAALATALIGWGATKVASPGVVAALAGLSLGAGALSGRALTVPEQPMEHLSATALAVVTEPFTWALVVFTVTGMLLYTNALQHGQVGPVTAILWIGEVIAPSAIALVLLGDTVRVGWEMSAAIAGLITVGAAVLLAMAPATGATAQPPEVEPSGAPRPALPLTGRRPAALPSRVGPLGTVLWWGSPASPLPLWRPPRRAMVARPPAAEPIWDRPHRSDVPAIEASRPAIAAASHRPAALSSRPHQAVPQPPRFEPAQAPALSERPSGAFIWSGPPSSRQAAWSPPERPTPARTPQITAEDRPYRPTSPWAEPPSGLIDQEETGWA